MSVKISKKVENLPPSGIREFFELVLKTEDIISLGVGEPDFATPWNIRESAIFSIEKGYTSYTSNKGLLKLRVEISKYLKNKFNLNYNPDDEILITVGVSEALDLSLRALLNIGDKVIIPEPCYVSYAPLVELAGGIPLFIATGFEDKFKLLPRMIRKACVNNKAKAIILNYPNNPTGASYTKEELEELSRVILKYNLVVISDEIYGELTYDFQHIPFSTLKGMKANTLYLNGFSKAYAMTGWRIGYACGPKNIISAMTKIHQYSMLCAPIISQIAAIEALTKSYNSVAQMKQEYKRRREFVVDGLKSVGLNCLKPEGAFYVFASCKNYNKDCVKFAQELLKVKKVACVPGVAFGSSGRGFIRISYASSLDMLREALDRIAEFIRGL